MPHRRRHRMPLLFLGKWGPAAWTFMHAATWTYAERPTAEERAKMEAFFRALPHVLPCSVCGGHFLAHVNTGLEAALAGRDTLTHWLVDVHNDVNRRTGKPERPYEQVRQDYLGTDAYHRRMTRRLRRQAQQADPRAARGPLARLGELTPTQRMWTGWCTCTTLVILVVVLMAVMQRRK